MVKIDPLRKSTDNNKILLEYYDFKDIRQAKKENRFKNLKAEEIYDILYNEYNNELNKVNQTLRKINENKQINKQKLLKKKIDKLNKDDEIKLAKANMIVESEWERSEYDSRK